MNTKKSSYPTLLLFMFSWVQARDPQPINNKFNIGQDIITSYQYGLVNICNLNTFKQNGTTDTQLDFSFSYGLTRSTGFTFTVPFWFNHNRYNTSRGLSDLSWIWQYQPYRTTNQLVVFKAGIQFPTGDTNSKPTLGSGSFNPLVTLATFHSSQKFFAAAIIEANIATTRRQKKAESTLEYLITLGPKFPLKFNDDSQLFTFLKLQGFLCFPRKFMGVKAPNSGRHLLLLGPLLSYDTIMDQYRLQLQVPISERVRGNQVKTSCVLLFSYQRNL